MIEAGQRYDATVLSAKFTESSAMTPGVWVNFQCFDGSAQSVGIKDKTIWLTPGNKANARKSLKALGATDAQLSTREFFVNVGNYLTGAQCSVTTEETEYKGKKRVEVKWINLNVKVASDGAAERAESLFADSGNGDGEDPGPDEVPY